LEGYNVADAPLVAFCNGFVEGEADGRTDAEFGKVEELKEVDCRGVEAENLRPEAVDKDLTGDER